MGIFKKLFKKEIRLDNKFSGELVYPALYSKKLKVGSTLYVPEGYAFVLASRGKVLDTYSSGEVELNLINMPVATKKLKLSKPDKSGKFKKKIDIDGYYVNLSEFVFPWKTYRKMVFKDKSYGYFKAKSNGEIVLQINNPTDFIKTLLTEYDYLKKGEAKKLLNNFISEFLTDKIEKKNYELYKVIKNCHSIENEIKELFTKKFNSYGVQINSFYIREFVVPKKYSQINFNSYSLGDLENVVIENPESVNNLSQPQNENNEIVPSKSVFADYGIRTEEFDNSNVKEKSVIEENSAIENIEESEQPFVFSIEKDENYDEDYKDNNFETTPYEITNPYGFDKEIEEELNIEEQKQQTQTKEENNKESQEEKIDEYDFSTSVFTNYSNKGTNKKQQKSQSKFVDLSLDNLYEKKEK